MWQEDKTIATQHRGIFKSFVEPEQVIYNSPVTVDSKNYKYINILRRQNTAVDNMPVGPENTKKLSHHIDKRFSQNFTTSGVKNELLSSNVSENKIKPLNIISYTQESSYENGKIQNANKQQDSSRHLIPNSNFTINSSIGAIPKSHSIRPHKPENTLEFQNKQSSTIKDKDNKIVMPLRSQRGENQTKTEA